MGNLYNECLDPYQSENQLLAGIFLSFAFLDLSPQKQLEWIVNLFDGIEVDFIIIIFKKLQLC